jgi:hypothetical protein
MTDYETRVKEMAGKLMDLLISLQDDRGAMADLRCAWSQTKRSRAWPLLGRAGLIGDRVGETVAGAFGYHPSLADEGNFGTACKKLLQEHAGAEQRFARLLDADRDNLCDLVRPLILAMRSVEVALNYRQLYIDLKFWGERTRVAWAREFWIREAEEGNGGPKEAEPGTQS